MGRRVSSLALLVAVIVTAMLPFAARAQQAASASTSSHRRAIYEANSPLPTVGPVCGKPTISREQFLDMFYAIAIHGDLTDVPFIEKTLGVKFDVNYSDNQDASGQPLRLATYETIKPSFSFGLPMKILLIIGVDSNNEPRNDKTIIMNFIAPFHDCLKIPLSIFSDKFGKNFHESLRVDNLAGASKELEGVGKNGSKILVGYGYDGRDNIMNNLAMQQRP